MGLCGSKGSECVEEGSVVRSFGIHQPAGGHLDQYCAAKNVDQIGDAQDGAAPPHAHQQGSDDAKAANIDDTSSDAHWFAQNVRDPPHSAPEESDLTASTSTRSDGLVEHGSVASSEE